jgi:hypothetical protein
MTWTAWTQDSGREYGLTAYTREGAVTRLVENYRGSDWPAKTYWITVVAESDDGGRWHGRVPVHPLEPECPEDPAGRHLWELFGKEPHGGGEIIEHRCFRCWLRKVRDTWATDPETGAEGLVSIEYEEDVQ